MQSCKTGSRNKARFMWHWYGREYVIVSHSKSAVLIEVQYDHLCFYRLPTLRLSAAYCSNAGFLKLLPRPATRPTEVASKVFILRKERVPFPMSLEFTVKYVRVRDRQHRLAIHTFLRSLFVSLTTRSYVFALFRGSRGHVCLHFFIHWSRTNHSVVVVYLSLLVCVFLHLLAMRTKQLPQPFSAAFTTTRLLLRHVFWR